MLIVYDYECTVCKKPDIRYVRPENKDNQVCCVVVRTEAGNEPIFCAQPLVRLPAATRTNFKFADTKLKRRPRATRK